MFGDYDEVVRMQREMFFDRKLDAALEAVGQAPDADGAGGDIDMGGDDDLDMDTDDGLG